MCLLPNSSETVCRIVLIFGGNIHLMPEQHLVMSIRLSVRELLLDCQISLILGGNIQDKLSTLAELS